MRIGFDLDDTLVPGIATQMAFLQHNERFYPPSDWWFENYPEHIKEQIYKNFLNETIMCDVQPYPRVLDTLKALKFNGYELFLLTARDNSIADATMEFVKRTFPDVFTEIIVDEDKFKYFKSLGLDIIIDDAPHVIEGALTIGKMRPYLVRTPLTPYNYHISNERVTVISEVSINELYCPSWAA